MNHLDLILTLTGGLAVALALGLLTRKIGLSPIVGYLLAGIVVSPNTPGFVAHKDLAKEMAEIGVILLMFGVGLHFHFKELLAVKRIAIPGAIVQSAVATGLAIVITMGFGWTWQEGAVFGMAIAVASTVVLTRVLVDNNHLHTPVGHIAIGWLVVEDLFTVFVLVLLPAVFGAPAEGAEAAASGGLIWAMLWTTVKICALVAFTFIVGGWAIPRLLAYIARTGSRELFTLAVLVIALGIAVGAAKLFGVSMELGAFLAGMVVARSEFSTRAATDALPMKDAFAVLFFVSVGMLFDFKAMLDAPGLVLATIGIVIIGKPLAAIAITLLLRYPLRTALYVGAVLAQIGEFSFIVGTLGRNLGVLSDSAFNALVATAIVSITLTPLLYRGVAPLESRLLRIPWLAKILARNTERKGDPSEYTQEQHHAIIIGYGPVGQTVVRLLKDNDIVPVVLEMNVDTVQKLKAEGITAIYGDATHPETLKQAGIDKARALILSSSGLEGKDLINEARRINPKIQIIARTSYLREAHQLTSAGADSVFSGEGEVALSMTEYMLEKLGATREQIDRESLRIREEFFTTPRVK
ncbi:CPA2 family monovalent cation:H+ antiporter-2 [Prosthecobacter fusiformis]|uniref:CPA2 family monovalent cation:H+ antiporter-2 n=1 Tax=Prosthecobacter fusiformis TaxID=48464 RepID=A0A4R7SRM6_9BACT|nr:cation:proton antiporter [Prosthecobacter fusiformis]TDU80808.1 CPA2 family monovalent cation:H+ antiporter-2 [Prosthecobacter fusiformis]